MLHLTKSLAASAALMASLAQAQVGPSVDSVCIHQLPESGPNVATSPLGKYFLQETDLPQFSLMGDTEKEFSMAQTLTVCHDRERVHGLQLTLKMHRYYYFDEEMMIEKYQLQEYYDHVDMMVASAQPRRLTMIGATSRYCETTDIFKYGSVKDVWVYSDETGIRSMKLKLTNGNEYDYGSDERDDLAIQKFNFEQGRQMMGIHGKVAYQPGKVNSDQLLTLGFFRDECSDTMQLFMSKERQRQFMESHIKEGQGQKLRTRGRGRDGDRDGKFPVTLILAIVTAVSLGITLFMCFRQKCKKEDRRVGGPQISIDRVNTHDETPQKAPHGLDTIVGIHDANNTSRISAIGISGPASPSGGVNDSATRFSSTNSSLRGISKLGDGSRRD